MALAILTDKRPLKETPGIFEFKEYGTELIYKYNLFEVYNQKDEELLDSDNPFDSFIYAAKKYSKYMKEDAQKEKLKYLLKITRNLYGRGLNEQDRRRILVFISRLINLKDAGLRKQYFDELKKLEGESKMRELTWLEEYFRDEAIAIGKEQGRSEGIAIGEERTLKAAIDFMRSSGMSNEQINVFRKSVSSDLA